MNPEQGDIYRGNKSTDFQPETGNPQAEVGSGLQPLGGTSLQTGNAQKKGSQEFPSVQKLQVLGVENASSARPQAQATTSPNQSVPTGLLAALFILVIVAAVIAWFARPNSVNKIDETTSELKNPEPKKPAKKKTSRKKRKNKHR